MKQPQRGGDGTPKKKRGLCVAWLDGWWASFKVVESQNGDEIVNKNAYIMPTPTRHMCAESRGQWWRQGDGVGGKDIPRPSSLLNPLLPVRNLLCA